MAYISGQYIDNPYRRGTKMRQVFDLFADGRPHSPAEVNLNSFGEYVLVGRI